MLSTSGEIGLDSATRFGAQRIWNPVRWYLRYAHTVVHSVTDGPLFSRTSEAKKGNPAH